MNTESVAGWLEAMGVPPEVVSVGVEVEDAWCLLRDDAEGQPSWEVFWREQGNRYDWARFSSEQVACFYLFGRLTWTQALRGVVGPLDTGTAAPGEAGVRGPEPAGPPRAPGQAAPAQAAPAPQHPGVASPTPPRGTAQPPVPPPGPGGQPGRPPYQG